MIAINTFFIISIVQDKYIHLTDLVGHSFSPHSVKRIWDCKVIPEKIQLIDEFYFVSARFTFYMFLNSSASSADSKTL